MYHAIYTCVFQKIQHVVGSVVPVVRVTYSQIGVFCTFVVIVTLQVCVYL